MAEHWVSSQQANPTPANTYPHPPLRQPQGQNHHVAGDDQEGVHREGILRPAGNVVMQGEMRYPPHIDAPNYNAANYYPPPPHFPHAPQAPYVHMYRDEAVAEPVPAQAHPFAPGAQENYDGYGAYYFPAAGPPEAFPGILPHPAPPADVPPVANSLRNLVDRFLNNPGTLVNMLRIAPRPEGRIEVWIVLESEDIYIF